MRHGIRLIGVLSAYALLPAAAFLLVQQGWTWSALAVIGLNLSLQVALLLVFTTFPLPARPQTLSRMDFAAVSWLPHVAVTRLTDRGLEGRAKDQRLGRTVFAWALLCGAPAPVAVVVTSRLGFGHPATWLVVLAVLSGTFLSLAYAGRELVAARGGLKWGEDIG